MKDRTDVRPEGAQTTTTDSPVRASAVTSAKVRAALASVPQQPTAPAAEQLPPGVRLVPALVQGQRVYIECFDWCEADHMAEDIAFIGDIDHGTHAVALAVPTYSGELDMVMDARLMTVGRPNERRTVFAVSGVGDGDAVELDSTRALAFLDQYMAHGKKLKSLIKRLAVIEAAEGEGRS